MPIDPHRDMCECSHSRAEHGSLDGHGRCQEHIIAYNGVTRLCPCTQFTWERFYEGPLYEYND